MPLLLALPASPPQRVIFRRTFSLDLSLVIFINLQYGSCNLLNNIRIKSVIIVKEVVFSHAKQAILQMKSLAVSVAAIANVNVDVFVGGKAFLQ